MDRNTHIPPEIQKTLAHFKQNNMRGFFASSSQEVLPLLDTLIPDGTVVGSGDSVTLEALEVFPYLRNRQMEFLDKFQPSLTKEQKRELYIRNFSADTFITSTNAITHTGCLFNIDGNGSRVAPMIYGPRQVIVVVGTNKLVPTVDDAIIRARQIAAPRDALRLQKNTPCTKTGTCVDCKHPDRICNTFVLIARQFIADRIKVIIVDGAFGY